VANILDIFGDFRYGMNYIVSMRKNGSVMANNSRKILDLEFLLIGIKLKLAFWHSLIRYTLEPGSENSLALYLIRTIQRVFSREIL